MNSLISRLTAEKNLTVKRLKQVYRELSKQTHPDLTNKKGDEFIRLRAEYEDALKILRNPDELSRISKQPARESPRTPREAVLQDLAMFAFKIFSDDAGRALDRMIAVSESYKPVLTEILTRYRDGYYRDFPKWRHIGRVYYAHNVFISAARQLFTYYASGKDRHKAIFEGCLRDLEVKARGLDNERGRILTELGAWLRVEMRKERVEVEYV